MSKKEEPKEKALTYLRKHKLTKGQLKSWINGSEFMIEMCIPLNVRNALDIAIKQAQQDLKTKILTIVWKVKEDRSSHKCERIIKKIKEV